MNATDSDEVAGVSDYLSIRSRAARDIPAADRLLGDLLTTTARVFLVGRTGLGKTLLALAIGHGVASGQAFLHWRSGRTARVLILDGEMPGELIRQRAIDQLRRAGEGPEPGRLSIYARDLEDEFTARCPTLGRMPPLNIEHGMNWTMSPIAALGGVDLVIFDNVMSLLEGVQKEEEAWTAVLPLVQGLTAKRIGQVWLDHSGHNQDRQYGSSTKAGRFDAVGIMAPLSAEERQRDQVAFTPSHSSRWQDAARDA